MTLSIFRLFLQVVDGNWGMGLSCPKYVFNPAVGAKKQGRYIPKTICGSSVPL